MASFDAGGGARTDRWAMCAGGGSIYWMYYCAHTHAMDTCSHAGELVCVCAWCGAYQTERHPSPPGRQHVISTCRCMPMCVLGVSSNDECESSQIWKLGPSAFCLLDPKVDRNLSERLAVFRRVAASASQLFATAASGCASPCSGSRCARTALRGGRAAGARVEGCAPSIWMHACERVT